MTTLLTTTMIHITCAFLLGLILGWLVWSMEREKGQNAVASDTEFWKNRLEEERRKRDQDLGTIEALKKEKRNFQKRIASTAS